MFVVSGSTWVPKSTYEHALDMLTAINTFLSPLNISLQVSMVNVVWWVCLGLGSLAAAYDQQLALVQDSLDPAKCADAQVPNLMVIAGIQPIPGSYSSLSVQFVADATGQTVPAGTHVRIADQTALFVTQAPLVVPPSGTASTVAICDTIGPIVVLTGQVIGTVETLTHISSTSNIVAAVAGANPETVTQQRIRLINGKTLTNTVDGLSVALRSLPGIQYAKTYYNPSSSAPLVLPGGISIPARTLYIVLQGASDLIADTVASITLIPTHGTHAQNFTSLAGQAIPINYDLAGTTPIYVKVYIDQNLPYSTGYLTQLRVVIEALASDVSIGQTITSELIAEALIHFPYATVNGVTVSNDGMTYGRTAVVPANNVPTFTDANISAVSE